MAEDVPLMAKRRAIAANQEVEDKGQDEGPRDRG